MRVREGGTDTFDLGGQWVANAQKEVMETLAELGLEVYPEYKEVSPVLSPSHQSGSTGGGK